MSTSFCSWAISQLAWFLLKVHFQTGSHFSFCLTVLPVGCYSAHFSHIGLESHLFLSCSVKLLVWTFRRNCPKLNLHPWISWFPFPSSCSRWHDPSQLFLLVFSVWGPDSLFVFSGVVEKGCEHSGRELWPINMKSSWIRRQGLPGPSQGPLCSPISLCRSSVSM